jgi:GTP-binding protein
MKSDSKEHPLVAIVGKPNVGKSALFNRLIRRRKAIVAEEPGVTRDINYETLTVHGTTCRIADSAGYVRDRDNVATITRKSNRKLINEAGLILFVCDIKNLDAQDFELSQIIRKSGKPCLLVVNKVDNDNLEEHAVDFYELGFDTPLPVSASHGKNISMLKGALSDRIRELQQHVETPVEHTPSSTNQDLHADVDVQSITVTIVGKPNVGKSSLLNQLVQKDRSLVTPEPGTTRDAVDAIMQYSGNTLRFIDTAGLRRRSKVRENVEYYSLIRTEQAIGDAVVAILVIDATEGVTTQDKKIAWTIAEKKRAMIIAANKWDLMQESPVIEREFRDDLYHAFPHAQYADIVPVSAQTGRNKKALLKKIIKVYNNYNRLLQTSVLNSFISSLPRSRGDIKYGYQKETAPPHFVFFVRSIDTDNVNFKRYLANALRKEFDLRGVPIDISLRKR